MATGTAETTPIPPPIQSSPSARFERYIEQQLDKTRSQVKLVDFFSSLLTLAVGVLGFLLVTALVDAWVFDLGIVGRALALVALVGGTGWFVTSRVLPLVLRQINPAYAARMIEQSQPSLKNSLINFWLLRSNRAGVHDLVYQAVEEQAATDLQHVPVDSTVDRSRLIQLGYALAGVVLVCALYKVLSPKDPFQTVARVFAPWSGVSRPARVEIDEVQPGDDKVFHGQTVQVSARVSGARSSDHVALIFGTVDGQITERIVALKMSADGLHYEGTLSPGDGGIQQDVTYRVAVFDRGVSESQLASASPVAETERFHLAVMPAPTITVQSVQYVYPSYTKRPVPPVSKQADLEALEGTKVTIAASANLPIKSAYIEFDPLPPQAGKPEQEASARAPLVLPMQAEGQDARCTFVLELAADRATPKYSSYQLRFITAEGDQNEQPILHRIAVLRDLSPEIEIVLPKGERIEVPEDGKQTIEMRALDPDFALSKISLRAVSGGSDLLDKSLLGASASGRGQAVVSYEFKPAELSLAEGDEVVFWGVAADNRTAPRTGLPEPNTERTRNYYIKITAAVEKPGAKPEGEKKPGEGEKEPQSGEEPKTKPGDTPPSGEGAKNKPPKSGDSGDGSKESDPQGGEKEGKKKLGDKYDGGDNSKTEPIDGKEGGKPGGNSKGATAPGDKSGNKSEGDKSGGEDGDDGDETEDAKPGDKSQGDKPGDPKQGDKSGDKSQGEKSGDKSQGDKSQGGNSGEKSPKQEGGKPNKNSQNPSGGEKKPGDKSAGGEKSSAGGQESGEGGNEPSEGNDENTGGPAGQGTNRRPGSGGGKESQGGQPGEGSQAESREGPLHDGEIVERVNELAKELEKKQGGQSGNKQPGSKQQGDKQPSGEQSGDKQPGGAEPGDKTPGEGTEPGNEQPGDKQPGGAQSGQKQPGGKQPGDKQPGGAQGGEKQPGGEKTPGDKQPGGEQSGNKQPGQKQPGDKQPGGGTGGEQQPKQPGEAASGNEGGNPQGPAETKPEQGGGGKKEGKSPAGGEGQNGQSGAGQKTQEQGGSPASSQENKDRDKKQGENGGGDKQGDEAKSSGQSKKQSDSKGGEGGEQSGGGKEGGGQGAKQAGNDSAGGNSPGDQGNGKADQPGSGQTSGKGGKGPISDKPTGVSGSEEGDGTNTKSGEGKEPGAGQPGKNASGQNKPGQKETKTGEKQSPGEGGAEPGGTGRPGDSRGKNSGASSGGGGQMNDAKNGPNTPGELPPEEKADLEYARKATDLALEHLRDQKDNPNPELLDKLGMTKEELAKFVERWESLKKAAAKDDPLGKRDLDESLRSLGLRSNKDKVRGGAGKKDDNKGLLDQGPRSEPPSSYLEQFNAFKRGTARAEK